MLPVFFLDQSGHCHASVCATSSWRVKKRLDPVAVFSALRHCKKGPGFSKNPNPISSMAHGGVGVPWELKVSIRALEKE